MKSQLPPHRNPTQPLVTALPEDQMFLTDEQVARLTGIRSAKGGISRAERQIEHLRKRGIPFWVDARGEPVIAKDALLARSTQPQKPEQWIPKPLR